MKECAKFRIIFLLFFSGLLIFSFEVRAAVCSSNDVMFNLSASVNAHASLYNAGYGYPVGVCYSDFFTGQYNGPGSGNVHATGNLVARLSAPTNAHIAAPGVTTYPQAVFYGDLQCAVMNRLAGETCENYVISGERSATILALTGSTNAHGALSDCSATRSVVYPYYLCCVSPSGNPECDYDGVQDPGENAMNCPDDVCTISSSTCGNGVLNGNEECDGSNFQGFTCQTLPGQGFTGGNLQCNSCRISTSQCTSGPVGTACNNNNICESGEGDSCEDCCHSTYDVTGGILPVNYCQDYSFVAGNKVDQCNRDCRHVAINDTFPPRGDGNFVNYNCRWNAVSNSCNFQGTRRGSSGATSVCEIVYQDQQTPDLLCGQDQDVYELRYQVVNTSGTYDACSDMCGSPTATGECVTNLPCPRVIRLPFFGVMQGVLAFMSILFCYGLLLWNTFRKHAHA